MTGIVARDLRRVSQAASKGPIIRPRIFLSWTFLFPFVVVGGATAWLASQGPDRHEARFVFSVPRPQPTPNMAVDLAAERVAIVSEEIQPLRVFFRSPERMRVALEAVESRARTATEEQLNRWSRRLSDQIRVQALDPDGGGERITVVATMWDTRPDLPVDILEFFKDELVRRYDRVDGFLDRRLAQLQSRRDEQKARVQTKREEIRSNLESAMPEGVDEPFDRLIDREDWVTALRDDFRASRAATTPDENVLTTEVQDFSAVRHRMRQLRTELAGEVEVLNELDTQLQGLEVKSRIVPPPSAIEPLRVLTSPVAENPPKDPLWLGLMAVTVGVAAGALSIFLRLMVLDMRVAAVERRSSHAR